jgi:two-component system cell cycle response regulator DivK
MGQRQRLQFYPPGKKDDDVKAKILYIEDNEQSLYLVTFLLNANGYEVLQARHGTEGIAVACRCRPDLILLDIQLPSMDGYAVASNLRSNPDLAETPIVAVTSFAMVGDREKALKAGCTGYIEKPINPDTFLREIGQYLSKCASRGSGEWPGS